MYQRKNGSVLKPVYFNPLMTVINYSNHEIVVGSIAPQ